jgi:hypothetical protein
VEALSQGEIMILFPILAVTGAVTILHHFFLQRTVVNPLKARVAALEEKTS